MNNLSELPSELYKFIFKNLSINDLIKLKLVCKRLKYFSEKYKINQLILTNGLQSSPNWFFTKKGINLDYQIKIDLSIQNKFRIFKREIINLELFERLKSLKLIYKLVNDNFNLTSYYITKFNQLEELDLHLTNPDRKLSNHNFIIKHQNLKTLHIFYIYHRSINLKFKCSNLEKLDFSLDKNSYKTLNLDKIKHLSGLCSINYDLLKFKNLEIIEFNATFGLNFNQLFQLPKLKVIKFKEFVNLSRIREFEALYFKMKKNRKFNLIVYVGQNLLFSN